MADSPTVEHEFVELLPKELEPGKLYLSVEYRTMAHLCFCGCGSRVVTPLSPTGWKLTFDGKAISISPSIGNWNLKCKSHYWITNGRVIWAEQWSDEEIAAGFSRDGRIKQDYYGETRQASPPERGTLGVDAPPHRERWWSKLVRKLR